MSSSYILEIKPLSEVSFENIFPIWLFPFSFCWEEAFYSMKFHLFILSFMSLVLGDISMKILLHGISEIFLPVFFSSTFYGITTYI